jgi:hypothetical protein
MAYKDSDELKTDERYPLGDYSFRVERSSVPGSTNDKIEAICTDKDGKNARKSIQVPSSTQVLGWYVEANSDTADVYAVIKGSGLPDWAKGETVPTGAGFTALSNGKEEYYEFSTGLGFCFSTTSQPGFIANVTISKQYASVLNSYTYNGLTAYYAAGYALGRFLSGPLYTGNLDSGSAAWVALYGSDFPDEEETVLIGRFAIDLEDAGGDGPGSDWDDPGDYDPDWEAGDPTHTLYVTVTGALSGRHNDPIEDPSYSYIPADKDTAKDYGCGGDGGHGGGGGAGASTVVIHKFATNQANSKEVTAIARRHGYGSGGGKGGKGGDGCILVYY